MTPFHDVPKILFLRRMVLPCAILVVFFFFFVGIVANSMEFQRSSGPIAAVPFWEASFKLYRDVAASISQTPEVCWAGGAVNDFQAHQCEEYWNHLFKSGGLALAPFVLVGLALFIGLENLTSTYRRVQKRAEKGKASFGGTVTDPAEAPGDAFSWFYCLRPVMVELPNKSQVKVYVPYEVEVPSPGQTLAIFESIRSLGESRHFAVVYAPHIAVLRGA